jgi:hypothetical protein
MPWGGETVTGGRVGSKTGSKRTAIPGHHGQCGATEAAGRATSSYWPGLHGKQEARGLLCRCASAQLSRATGTGGAGCPAGHGPQFEPADPASWLDPSVTTVTEMTRYGTRRGSVLGPAAPTARQLHRLEGQGQRRTAHSGRQVDPRRWKGHAGAAAAGAGFRRFTASAEIACKTARLAFCAASSELS